MSKNLNKKEIDKFSKIAEDWWNPEGKFKPLHQFNPERIKYIKDNTETCHHVTLKDEIFQKLTQKKITKKKLINLSFEFLLKK